MKRRALASSGPLTSITSMAPPSTFPAQPDRTKTAARTKPRSRFTAPTIGGPQTEAYSGLRDHRPGGLSSGPCRRWSWSPTSLGGERGEGRPRRRALELRGGLRPQAGDRGRRADDARRRGRRPPGGLHGRNGDHQGHPSEGRSTAACGPSPRPACRHLPGPTRRSRRRRGQTDRRVRVALGALGRRRGFGGTGRTRGRGGMSAIPAGMDRRELEAVVAPFGQSRTLPSAAYTSEETLAWEVENVLRKTWVCVGRFDELLG